MRFRRSPSSSFAASVRRIAFASALAIPACAALTVVMYFVPPAVCIGALFIGLTAFAVGLFVHDLLTVIMRASPPVERLPIGRL